jgi:hypothetical protein
MTTEERLERVERELRRWRRGALMMAVLVVAAAGLGWARTPEVPDVVKARKFLLVDDRGRIRAGLYTVVDKGHDKEVCLAMQDEDGRIKVLLSNREGWSSLRFFDPGKEVKLLRAAFEYSPADGGKVEFYNESGRLQDRFPARRTPGGGL